MVLPQVYEHSWRNCNALSEQAPQGCEEKGLMSESRSNRWVHDAHVPAQVFRTRTTGRTDAAPHAGVDVDEVSALHAGNAGAFIRYFAHHFLAGDPRQHEVPVADPDQLEIGPAKLRHE